MAKRKPYKLSIPEPCSQNWDKMPLQGDGRHCSKCNHIIVDFSKYTDRELIDLLKNKPHGCGKFAPHQVDRPLAIPVEQSNPFFYKALFAASFIAGIVSTGYGQSMHSMPMAQVPLPTTPFSIPVAGQLSAEDVDSFFNEKDSSHVLKGYVYNAKTKEGIEYASVSIQVNGKEFETSIVCEYDGTFAIKLPANSEGQSIQMSFTDFYYKDRTINTIVNTAKPINVGLKRNHKRYRRMVVGKF